MFLYLLGTIVLLLLLLSYKVRAIQKTFKGIDSFPGPRQYPIIGNALSFGYNLPDVFKYVNILPDTYGKIARIWPVYLSPAIITSDADVIAALLSSTKWITKARDYKYFWPWLGQGLLMSTGEKWHKRRKLLTPAFHFQILEQFVEIFSKEANQLVESLEDHVGDKSVNIYPMVNKCALDVICKTAMGIDMRTQSGKNMDYLKAVKEMLRIIGIRAFSIVKCTDFGFMFTLDYFRMKKTLRILHDFTHAVIAERRRLLLQDDQSTRTSAKRKAAFLDLLIRAKQEGKLLSDIDIQEEVDTFLFEGFDTVTSAVSFTIYELSRNPHVQAKIVNELKSVLGENFVEPINTEKLNAMTYLGQVIKEGLRLYPPVAIFQRQISEEFNVGQHTFPPGTIFIVNTYHLHRQEEFFPNPEKFDPDRFAEDAWSTNEKHPFCYLPFSGGPRNCIGQKFAMNEMKVTLSKLLMKFKFLPTEPKHELVIFTDGILKSENGIRVRISRRE